MTLFSLPLAYSRALSVAQLGIVGAILLLSMPSVFATCIYQGGTDVCPLDCIQEGGEAECISPEVDDNWQYTVCAVLPNPPPVERADNEGEAVSFADKFIDISERPQLCSSIEVEDTGWGYMPQGGTCWDDGTVYESGLIIREQRLRVNRALEENISAGTCSIDIIRRADMIRTRSTYCPDGYFKRRITPQDTANYYCVSEIAYSLGLPDNPSGCGEANPCNPATGAKFQTEADVPMNNQGLGFSRYYNTQGQYRDSKSLGPNWRHNYGGRLLISPEGEL